MNWIWLMLAEYISSDSEGCFKEHGQQKQNKWKPTLSLHNDTFRQKKIIRIMTFGALKILFQPVFPAFPYSVEPMTSQVNANAAAKFS